MDEIGLQALKALFSQCGGVTVLLVIALVYQTLGRAKDRQAHLEDSKTWTTQAGAWVAASANIMAALSSDKELTAARDAQVMDALDRVEAHLMNNVTRRR